MYTMRHEGINQNVRMNENVDTSYATTEWRLLRQRALRQSASTSGVPESGRGGR